MATMAYPARDILKHFGRDSFAAVAARSVPVTKSHPLPTPPNSISPSLPPHGLKPYGTRSATAQAVMEHVDSDLDLRASPGGSRQHSPGDRKHVASSGSDRDRDGSPDDTTGTITPALLAKHHLPGILLAHGPLAIRHVMGYLTTSVPGFSGIPPAKARRLVVAALEGRGNGGEGTGVHGDVEFDKVGWGRWDAKLKGKAGRQSRRSPPPSVPSSYSVAMPIAKTGISFDRTRLATDSSWAGDSAVFSHDDDMEVMMAENEADKMSLDGSCSSSEAAAFDDVIMGDDPDDVTDDEDWAAVGAAALRAASCSGPGGKLYDSRSYAGRSHSGGGPSLLSLAKSVPAPQSNNVDFSAFGMTSDSQEREAIEALLRLGSV